MVQFRRHYGIIPSQAMPSKSHFGATVAGIPNRWSPPFKRRSETPFSGVFVGLLATLLSALLGIGVEDVVLASSPIFDVVCQRRATAIVVPLPASFEDCSSTVDDAATEDLRSFGAGLDNNIYQ